MEPITTALTAGAIVELAFGEIVKAGAGEAGKRLTAAALDSVKKLRAQICAKFQGDVRAEKALQELERQHTDVASRKVANYLDNAMLEDEEFSSNIQKTAQTVYEIVFQPEIYNFNRLSLRDGNTIIFSPHYSEKSSKESNNERDNDPKELDYTHLQELLDSKDWLAADQETHRLMLQAKGKDEENWLRDQEIIYFPCNTLQAIDELWMRASSGRFGFSVQQEIFASFRLETLASNDAAWDKFQKTVGWLTRKHLLASYEFTSPYSIGNPNLSKGCLPFRTIFFFPRGNNSLTLDIPVSEGWFRRFLYLGWRLRHCNDRNNE